MAPSHILMALTLPFLLHPSGPYAVTSHSLFPLSTDEILTKMKTCSHRCQLKSLPISCSIRSVTFISILYPLKHFCGLASKGPQPRCCPRDTLGGRPVGHSMPAEHPRSASLGSLPLPFPMLSMSSQPQLDVALQYLGTVSRKLDG